MSEIQSLTAQALADVAAAQTPDQLETLRVALLGKNGSITAQAQAARHVAGRPAQGGW